MAFDAAAQGGRVPTGEEEGPVALLNTASQRVWTLVQVVQAVENLVKSIGTDGDTTALRSRLAGQEKTAVALRGEIDNLLRTVRVELVNSEARDVYASRTFERTAGQYREVRERLGAALEASARKQREYTPRAVPAMVGGGGLPGAVEEGGRGGGGARGGRKPDAGVAGGQIMIELSNFQNAEDALAAERAEEARAIAVDALELRTMVQETQTVIVQQGEMLTEVERNVDHAFESVKAGTGELTRAAEYQRKYRRKMAIFIILLLGLIAAIAVPLALKYA